MADAYIIETIEERNNRFGDSHGDDLHGGLHMRHRLQHAPNDQFPSYIIIQTSGVVDSRDNPVQYVDEREVFNINDWVVIGHLTRGSRTHIIEIGTPARVRQEFNLRISTHTISGGDIGDNWVAPNALDDFTVTSIQILYRPL